MSRRVFDPNIPKLFVGNTRQADMNIYFWGSNSDFPKDQTFGPVLRDHFLIIYCVTGSGTVTLDGVSHFLEPGQCMMTFPNQVMSMFSSSRTPWNIIWVGLKGMLLPYYLQRMGISSSNPIFPWRNSEYILHELKRILQSSPEYENNDIFDFASPLNTTKGELVRLSCLYSILSEAYSLCSRFAELNGQASEYEDYIQKAIAFMEANCNRKIKISDVAKHVGLNRSYLFTLFKEHLTESPQEFMTRLKIKKACEMFRSADATVSSVAYSLGYEPRALTRLFKQITGYTPTEYRRTMHEER